MSLAPAPNGGGSGGGAAPAPDPFPRIPLGNGGDVKNAAAQMDAAAEYMENANSQLNAAAADVVGSWKGYAADNYARGVGSLVQSTGDNALALREGASVLRGYAASLADIQATCHQLRSQYDDATRRMNAAHRPEHAASASAEATQYARQANQALGEFWAQSRHDQALVQDASDQLATPASIWSHNGVLQVGTPDHPTPGSAGYWTWVDGHSSATSPGDLTAVITSILAPVVGKLVETGGEALWDIVADKLAVEAGDSAESKVLAEINADLKKAEDEAGGPTEEPDPGTGELEEERRREFAEKSLADFAEHAGIIPEGTAEPIKAIIEAAPFLRYQAIFKLIAIRDMLASMDSPLADKAVGVLSSAIDRMS